MATLKRALNTVFTKIAVMESAPDTLISIFEFEIKQKLVGTGIYLNDNLVFPGTVAYRRFSLILILKFPGSTRRSLVSFLSDLLSEPFIPIFILRHVYFELYFKILEFIHHSRIHLISLTTPRWYPSRYQPPESHYCFLVV